MNPRVRRVALVLTVVLGVAVVALVVRTNRGGSTASAPPGMIGAPGISRDALTTEDAAAAEALIGAYVAETVIDAPALSGLQLTSISPVYNEESPQPIGAMGRLITPEVVETVTIDLVRSDKGIPYFIDSEVTNLRGLDAIVLFDSGEVISVSVAPLADDATDPSMATRVRPLDPSAHEDPRFGDTD